jgi:hypothetical protein
MAVTGTIYLTGELAGEPEGSSKISLSWLITDGATSSVFNLASGANTITVPDKASLVIIVPPVTNIATLILKGVSGDVGIALDANAPTVFSREAGTSTSFVLTAGAAVAGLKVLFI